MHNATGQFAHVNGHIRIGHIEFRVLPNLGAYKREDDGKPYVLLDLLSDRKVIKDGVAEKTGIQAWTMRNGFRLAAVPVELLEKLPLEYYKTETQELIRGFIADSKKPEPREPEL